MWRCRRAASTTQNISRNFFCIVSATPLFLHSQKTNSSFKIIEVSLSKQAEVAHLVEHDLAKVGVAGSSPVFRS